MSLQPGTRLGPYEIIALLGEGGMGAVYRARDAKLQRDVAIKVLPETFADDRDRLARFEREAVVLASLNHPNIAAIYGVEESGGVRALVMELVEGRTLAETAALPIDDVLAIARQIADALEAAHEAGVVHRDLKPANIKVRDDGTVKVLDFGLAKAIEPVTGRAGSGPPDSGRTEGRPSAGALPTMTSPALTEMGIILGTAAYMAPEQAKGRAVDRRADIWAFGVVLYEMLSGRRPFDGDTISETIANVLKEQPDWSVLPAPTPTAVRRLLTRALEKDPRRRLQSIGDARLELEEAASRTGASSAANDGAQSGTLRPNRRLSVPATGAIVTLGLAAAVGWGLLLAGRPDAAPGQTVLRLSVAPPDNHRIAGSEYGGESEPYWAVSPDGRQIAFVAVDENKVAQIWVRPFDSFASRPLAGTDGANAPFWSPNGEFIGFVAGGRLKRVPAAGGAVRTICATPDLTKASWGDGVILMTFGSGLWMVSDVGGEPEPLDGESEPGSGAMGFWQAQWPSFLPDGRHFTYVRLSRVSTERVAVLGSLDSPERTELVQTPFMARAGAGHLLYVADGLLVARRLDLDARALTGPVITVVEDLSLGEVPGQAKFHVSASGVIAYQPRNFMFQSQLVWVNREGRTFDEVGQPDGYLAFDVAPDGRKLSLATQDRSVENEEPPSLVWLFDVARRVRTRLPMPGMRSVENPLWSPDGTRLVYAAHERAGAFAETRIQSASGTGAGELVAGGDMNFHPIDWSADGRWLLLHGFSNTLGRIELWSVDLEGDRAPALYARNDGTVAQGQFAPGGRFVAYSSDVTGRPEVYLQRFPAGEERWQVSANGGEQPRWRDDGRELFYLAPDGSLVAVAVTLEETPGVGTPKSLFRAEFVETQYYFYGGAPMYAVAHDGQSFLINRNHRRAGSGTINIVLNAIPR
jgi:Tol biopolymer transport system component/tRNA A-37 threonylcarbamoyl transferase component Bud32